MAEAHSLDEETGTHECNVAVGTNGEKKADGCSSELLIDNEAAICSVKMDDSKESASSDAVWHNSPAFKFISRPDLYQFAKVRLLVHIILISEFIRYRGLGTQGYPPPPPPPPPPPSKLY